MAEKSTKKKASSKPKKADVRASLVAKVNEIGHLYPAKRDEILALIENL